MLRADHIRGGEEAFVIVGAQLEPVHRRFLVAVLCRARAYVRKYWRGC